MFKLRLTTLIFSPATCRTGRRRRGLAGLAGGAMIHDCIQCAAVAPTEVKRLSTNLKGSPNDRRAICLGGGGALTPSPWRSSKPPGPCRRPPGPWPTSFMCWRWSKRWQVMLAVVHAALAVASSWPGCWIHDPLPGGTVGACALDSFRRGVEIRLAFALPAGRWPD